MIAGAYHYGRPDVAGNTGTDEANHFIEAAGPWLRPGYMMPMYDMEAGQSLGGNAIAQFAVDFSNRLYAVTGIRPSMYINGSYSGTLQGASAVAARSVGEAGRQLADDGGAGVPGAMECAVFGQLE